MSRSLPLAMAAKTSGSSRPRRAPRASPAGHAEDVRGDRAELDVGALERLVEPLRLARSLLDQAAPVADELALLALAAIGDEAAAQQAVAEQVGDPLGIADIGLAPGHGPDVAGVDDQQLEPRALEQVVVRLPVDAGRLHRDVGHAEGEQPIGERQQLVGQGAERAQLAASRGDDARDYRVAVDVEPGAAFVDDLHGAPHASASGRGGLERGRL